MFISRLNCCPENGIVHFFPESTIPFCPYITSCLSINLFMDLLFASMSWLFQYCCSAHLPASVFPILVVLGYRPKRCPAPSYGSSIFTFSSRRRHTRSDRDWSSDVCSSDLKTALFIFFPRLLFHCIYVPHLLYPFICRWTLRLLPCPGYCK